MTTSIKITNEKLYNKLVIDVDTTELKSTDNYNGTRTFAAQGNLFIELESGNHIEGAGEFCSTDYEEEFGFVLIAE